MKLDAAIVQERLRLLRELLDDLDEAGEVTAELLEENRLTRHAIERIMTQLVELAVSINSHICAAIQEQAPGTYRDSFLSVAKTGAISLELAQELAPSAGLRNILTHEYTTINLQLVAEAVPEAASGYREYMRQVARFLQSGASQLSWWKATPRMASPLPHGWR